MISQEAQNILSSSAFNEVMDYMEDKIIQRMKTSAYQDLDTHHELVLSLQVMENVRKVLEKLAHEGQVAEFNTKMMKSVV